VTPDFDTLYLDFRGAIFEYIRRRVQRPGTSNELAEDLTADTFRKAFEALQRGVEVDTPSAWIHKIARNTIIDYYRLCGRRVSTVALELVADEPTPELSPHDYAMSAIGCECIQRCIDRLTEGQAYALSLLVEGYRSVDLGDIMGITDSGGKQVLLRARRQLSELLEQRGYA
jgi:RNA polymerase sigma-70 factor (ECF subfamily)